MAFIFVLHALICLGVIEYFLPRLMKFFVGKVMAATKGKANPELVTALLKDILMQ